MANKWQASEPKKDYPTKGLAVIRTGTNKAKITFVGKDKRGNPNVWANGEPSKVFQKNDLPNTFVFEPKTEGEYYVCTGFDKDSVFAIGPWKGTFKMRVHDISRDSDTKEPRYWESSGVDKETGRPYSSLRFKLFWKITEDGEFKGCIVAENFVYQDGEQGRGNGVEEALDASGNGIGETKWRGPSDNFSERAVWQPRIVEAFDKLHVADSVIEWPPDGNILPEVWNRIENSPEQEFYMDVDKGEVVGFSQVQGKRKIDDFDDDEDEPEWLKEPEEDDDEFDSEKVINELGADYSGKPKRKTKKVVEEDADDDL